MRSVPRARFIALCLCVGAAIVTQTAALAQSTLFVLTSRRDMVFDHSGRYIYITTSDGFVRRYNLSTGFLDASYNLGGSLLGADIASDDSFLLVGQTQVSGSQGTLHKVDLVTGTVTNINYPVDFQERGVFDVAIGSNGRALFTTLIDGSGWTPLRQVDLATNVVTVRTDVPGANFDHTVTSPMQVHRSADRTRLFFLGANDSIGPAFTYNAVTNSFGPETEAGMYFSNASAAVNRDGTLLGTLVGLQAGVPSIHQPKVALDAAPGLEFVRSFREPDGGIAFDAISDTLYAVSSAGQIIAYDTRTFAEKFRIAIGHAVSKGILLFGAGTLVASPDGRRLALTVEVGVRVFTLPTVPPAPTPSPTPTLATRRDMVFDHSGQFLYLTTSTGLVERYHLATGELTVIADLGGSLNGADIAADDSCLLVAQDHIGIKQGAFQKVDLATGAVTNINYKREYPEAGAFDVAIGSNGAALVTTRVHPGFSGGTPPRQVDLATNAIFIRTDVPGSGDINPTINYRTVSQDTQIVRNAAGTRFYFLEGNSSGGPIFTYDAATDTFGPNARTNTFLDFASAAVSRDGSLLATRHGGEDDSSLETAPDFNLVQTFGFDGGVAFDAVTNTLYGVDSGVNQIIAYDTNTLVEKYRLDIGEDISPHSTPFDTGTLMASNDGRYLALETASGIRFFTIPTQIPTPLPALTPVFLAPRDMVFDHSGQYLYITTYTGVVWRYNLLTSSLEVPYNLGGALNGVDIAPDDSFLLVAQSDTGLIQGRFQKLTLGSGAITNVNYLREFTESGGAWDVAIASNGLALVTTEGYGFQPVRQIDLATNAISVRTDAAVSGGLFRLAPIQRSADRTRICFFEPHLSPRRVFSYSAASNTFGQVGQNLASVGSAVNRDGSLLGASRHDQDASLNTLPDFGFVHTFAGLDHAVAFDAVQDVFYGVSNATDQIIGYDTATFTERTRLPVGENIHEFDQPMAFDSGNMVASPNGRYLALIAPRALRVFDLATGTSSALSTLPYVGNISTRAIVGLGDNVPIGGFIVTGSDPKKVVVRAIGPSLAPFGIPNAVQDPILELRDHSGAVIALNDNWRDPHEADVELTRLEPSDDREATIVATLLPGSYTAIMRGANATTGVGVVEIYDVDPNAKSRLANISTRGTVGTGDNVMIAGVIVGGSEYPVYSIHERTVVVRGLGPSLAQSGVPNALPDPTLELYDGNGTIIRENDNWRGWQESAIEAVGLGLTNDLESAIIISLRPGSYTAILRGMNNTTGVGLVEVYSLP